MLLLEHVSLIFKKTIVSRWVNRLKFIVMHQMGLWLDEVSMRVQNQRDIRGMIIEFSNKHTRRGMGFPYRCLLSGLQDWVQDESLIPESMENFQIIYHLLPL